MSSLDSHHHPLPSTMVKKKNFNSNQTILKNKINPTNNGHKPVFKVFIDQDLPASSSPSLGTQKVPTYSSKHPINFKTPSAKSQRQLNQKLSFTTGDQDANDRQPCSPKTTTHQTNTTKPKNPLEDKTNTIRKARKNFRIEEEPDQEDQSNPSPTKHKSTAKPDDLKQPQSTDSHSVLAPTPLPKSPLPSSVSPKKYRTIQTTQPVSDPKVDHYKRLLYRTPVTSKRGQIPPNAQQPSSSVSNGEGDLSNESISLSSSGYPSIQIDFTQDQIPDVEYGPPSAITELLEYSPLEDRDGVILNEHKNFDRFFESLKTQPSSYHNNSLLSCSDQSPESVWDNDVNKQIERIMLVDGQKDRWTFEPRCEITDYQGDYLLDELHIPSRSSPPVPSPRRSNLMNDCDSKSRKPSYLSSSPSLRTTLSTATMHSGYTAGRLASLRPRPIRSEKPLAKLPDASGSRSSSLRATPAECPSQSNLSIRASSQSLQTKPRLEKRPPSRISSVTTQSIPQQPRVKHSTSPPNNLIGPPNPKRNPPNPHVVCYQQLLSRLIDEDQARISADLDRFLSSSPLGHFDDHPSHLSHHPPTFDAELDHFRFDV